MKKVIIGAIIGFFLSQFSNHIAFNREKKDITKALYIEICNIEYTLYDILKNPFSIAEINDFNLVTLKFYDTFLPKCSVLSRYDLAQLSKLYSTIEKMAALKKFLSDKEEANKKTIDTFYLHLVSAITTANLLLERFGKFYPDLYNYELSTSLAPLRSLAIQNHPDHPELKELPLIPERVIGLKESIWLKMRDQYFKGENMMWKMLGVIAVILSVIYFRRGKNAVWGGLTIGVILGSIIAVILAFMGKGFDWHIILKTIIIAILVGFVAELLAIVPKLFKGRNN